MVVGNGSVVVDWGVDETRDGEQITSITAVDVAVVDVDVRAAIWTQVFTQHPQHVC